MLATRTSYTNQLRNINGAAAKAPAELNVEDVLRYENFVISEQALEALNKRLGGAE